MYKKVTIVAIAFMLAMTSLSGDVFAARKRGFDVGSVVGGIVGGIGSGVVTNWIMNPKPRPDVVYVERPRVVERVVVERVVVKRYLTPWSAEWYQACAEKWDSFNARTGEWTAYNGQQHFCKIRVQ